MEFFVRNTKVTVGTKADQETNFPVQYQVNGNLEYNRFLKNHVPSENVFKKLFASIPFFLNVESTATITTQGLVKVATDQKAFDRESEADGNMRSVIEPHQLSEVKNQVITAQTITGDITINFPTITNISNANIVKFVIGATVSGAGIQAGSTIVSIDYSTNEIELSLDCTATTVGVTITQIAEDTTFNNITFRGIVIGTFKRTIGTKFRKMYYAALAFQHSLVIDKDTQRLQLDGDVASPGNYYYYGTDGTGAKGWQNGAYINEVYTTITGTASIASGGSSILCTYTALDTNTLAINYLGRAFADASGDELKVNVFLKKNGVTIFQLGSQTPASVGTQPTCTISDFLTVDVIATDVITLEAGNVGADALTIDGKLTYKKIA